MGGEKMDEGLKPRLYSEFASWWPVLSSPEDYAEEADFYYNAILHASPKMPKTILELGSGGGNNASYLKNHFKMTLVDLSPGMLEVSRKLNPDCEHILGDMRSIRLGRQFDAIFIHDAIMYMTSEVDLRQVIETAYLHCKPGGTALFAPDHVRESFHSETKHGGHDSEHCSLRYVEWNWDPDPLDETYVCDFAYLLREEDGEMRCEYDRHILGLFERETWLKLLQDVGFDPRSIPFEHSELEPGSCEVFLGLRPVG
jgi:SAM-dependent methyltransferase